MTVGYPNVRKLVAVVIASLTLAGTWIVASAEPAFVSMGTGPVSGIYYPTGRSICDVVNAVAGMTLRCSVEATPGSVYNVEAVASGEIEFALIQSDVQFFSSRGEGHWMNRPVGKLRSVMSLYPELLTIMARPDAGIHDLDGLKGKRVNIGMSETGTRATWDEIADTFGISAGDLMEAAKLKPAAAIERMCAKTLDANLLIVGHPSKMVESQLATCGLVLAGASEERISKLVSSRPYYVSATIPAAYYGLGSDVRTFGVKATLVSSADVPDDLVYVLVKTIMMNLDNLKAQSPSLAGLKPEEMISQSLTAPLHPGAARAYRELGLLK